MTAAAAPTAAAWNCAQLHPSLQQWLTVALLPGSSRRAAALYYAAGMGLLLLQQLREQVCIGSLKD
jgi:hypothetical protein